jgi:hypothetical protein
MEISLSVTVVLWVGGGDALNYKRRKDLIVAFFGGGGKFIPFELGSVSA